MDQTEVTPWPQEGQFWALLEPLTLLQVASATAMEENPVISFRQWHPVTLEVNEPNHEATFLGPLKAESFRYLWYVAILSEVEARTVFPIEVEVPPPPGSAWIDAELEEVLFVGPSDDDRVRILADWDVMAVFRESNLKLRPYPPIPAPEKQGTDRYSVLSGDDKV